MDTATAATLELVVAPPALPAARIEWFPLTRASLRRCIYCSGLITFEWIRFPAVADRRGQVTHYAYAHPDHEACQRDHDRRAPDADLNDWGVQRARALDALSRNGNGSQP